MKKLAFLLLLFIQLHASNAFVESDKQQHLLIGAYLYFVCIAIEESAEVDWLNEKTCLVAVGAVALGKEVYDGLHDDPADFDDISATMFVPFVSYTIMTW